LGRKLKNFNVIWTKNAQYDLEEIIEYIKTDSLKVAKDIFFEIKEQCNNLSISPMSRRVVLKLLFL